MADLPAHEPFIDALIIEVRGTRVILDSDLAKLYRVTTSALTQAVKRNMDRFPDDFMFQLSKREHELLLSQIVISKPERRGGRRTPPYAFTEQGVAMLSGVLRSPLAVQVNVAIMRAFVRLRRFALTHDELASRLDTLEEKFDQQFSVVFEAIQAMLMAGEQEQRRIGFKLDND